MLKSIISKLQIKIKVVLVLNENKSSAEVYPSEKCDILGNEGRKIVQYVYGKLLRCRNKLDSTW